MQGFRKSSAWRWSAAQHQKQNKNGRYYSKHLSLSLLLQSLWCSARGAQGEEFTGSVWELLRGSSGWFLQLSPDLEGFSITKDWGWPWAWSLKGGQKQHISTRFPRAQTPGGCREMDPHTPALTGAVDIGWAELSGIGKAESAEHWALRVEGVRCGSWASPLCQELPQATAVITTPFCSLF